MEANRNIRDNTTAQQDLFNSTNCPGIGSAKEYRCLNRLIQGAVSRQELDELLDVANAPDFVMRFKARGWVVITSSAPEIDVDGCKKEVGFYSLASHQRDCAIQALTLYKQSLGGESL